MDNFEIIIDKYLMLLRKIVGAIILNHHDVDEVIQNTLIKAYKNWDKVKDSEYLKAWLVTVARNEAYNFCRSLNRHKKYFAEAMINNDDDREQQNILLESAGSQSEHESYLVNDELSIALMNIKDVYREALIAVTVDGLSTKEACELMNCSQTLLHWRIHKARAALKKELKSLNKVIPKCDYNNQLHFCGDER